jgi:hypothetical protein
VALPYVGRGARGIRLPDVSRHQLETEQGRAWLLGFGTGTLGRIGFRSAALANWMLCWYERRVQRRLSPAGWNGINGHGSQPDGWSAASNVHGIDRHWAT